MAREIKFRAFWKPKGIMVTKKLNEQFWYTPENKAINHSYGTDELFAKHELSEPMEITGLKDKNGKEIYEGDIFKHGEFQDGSSVLYILEWKRESAGFGWKQITPCLTFAFDISDIEVVGNIYENPELLATPTTNQTNRQVKDG